MGVINNFNKIINIEFLNSAGVPVPLMGITCPFKGRKPNIEITGQLQPNSNITAFTIKIKNLYMNFSIGDIQQVSVTAGYENGATISFIGSINYAYTDSPGPESTTIIQCLNSDITPWENKWVTIDEENPTIGALLTKITTAVGLPAPQVAPSLTKTLGGPFKITALAKYATKKIVTAFSDIYPGLVITFGNVGIKAYDSQSTAEGRPFLVNWLKTPPVIVGGGENAVTATITSLWNPEIRPGDIVQFNSQFYTTTNKLALYAPETSIKVNTIDFQFSTVGSANQMTIMGTKI